MQSLTKEAVLSHPHLNPVFGQQMHARLSAQQFNRGNNLLKMPVPKQPNRYVPHVGKKEAARHAGKTTLGFNASRALRRGAGERLVTAAKEARDIAMDVQWAGDFAVLDRVTWTSSGKAKEGQIVAVVPAGKLPIDVDMKVKDATSPRDHVSYVVQSGKTIYWPRVSLLERV